MHEPPSENPLDLLDRAVKLTLFVMLRRTLKTAEVRAHLGDHLRWMIGEERRGRIFLSGPVAAHSGEPQLDGLTIIRVADLDEARSVALADPLVERGIVAFELREWTVNEGSIPLTISLSDSSVSIARG